MFWIAGADELFRALAKWANAPWSPWVERQLEHADWQGFYFYDLIFPLFLFLVGVVLPFSLAKQASLPQKLTRIARRTALLILLGLIYNGLLRFQWHQLRLAGVLQRIGICYALGALIVLATRSSILARTAIAIAILIAYTAILQSIPPPGGVAGDLSKENNLAGWIDRNFLPGKIMKAYYGYGDNEGILSTIPAIATVLLGSVAGEILRRNSTEKQKILTLISWGAVCLAPVALGATRQPIIKILWTPSFVLLTAGCSFLLLALFYTLIDVLQFKRWAFPFIVLGANAITIYLLPGIIDFNHTANFLFGGLDQFLGSFAPVLNAAAILLLEWLLLLVLYKNRWFLRV
jgi:predicted acyltransferase